jgi:exopolysaccharide biosynthesis protein
VAYASFRRGNAIYHVVTANLADRAVVRTVHSPRLTSVWRLLSRDQPVAAITGTFFSPAGHSPVADVVVDGNLVASGRRGSVLAVDWFGKVRVFDLPRKTKQDWFVYRYALRGLVRVVRKGKVSPNPKAQGFRDSRIWSRAARTGAGIRKDGKLVIIATPNSVTLSELGKAMIDRGIVEGVSLDGGGSTCLYYRGKLVIRPKRKLSNLLVVLESPLAWTSAEAHRR